MIERKLTPPAGYDGTANPRLASFAAQLEDQLRRLREETAELETRHYEWQPHPGLNTAGMLIAHLAVVEVWWFCAAPRELPEPETEALFQRLIQFGGDDDGMPVKPDGVHPPTLAGWTPDQYRQLLDAARVAVHEVLRGWRDAELQDTFKLRDRTFTKEWTAYHVLEHFAAHFGQISLLKHLMRDAGVLAPKPKT